MSSLILMSVTQLRGAKMAEWIEFSFFVWTVALARFYCIHGQRYCAWLLSLYLVTVRVCVARLLSLYLATVRACVTWLLSLYLVTVRACVARLLSLYLVTVHVCVV